MDKKNNWPQTVENKMNHMQGLGFYIKKVETNIDSYSQYMSVGVLPGYDEPAIYTWGFMLEEDNKFTVSATRFVKDTLIGYWSYEPCDFDHLNDALDFFTTLDKNFKLEPLEFLLPELDEE